MKALLTLLAALVLAVPAWAGRSLTITAPSSVTVGDTIIVSYDLPTSGQAVNLLAVRTEWNEALASFHSWMLAGSVFQQTVSLPCNLNAQGKMKFSTTGWSTTAAGHIATMKLIAISAGTLTLVFGNGCQAWEPVPTFYNAGIIVPTDAFTASATVVIHGVAGGCSPFPCEIDKTSHIGVPVRSPRPGDWTSVAARPWPAVKALYR